MPAHVAVACVPFALYSPGLAQTSLHSMPATRLATAYAAARLCLGVVAALVVLPPGKYFCMGGGLAVHGNCPPQLCANVDWRGGAQYLPPSRSTNLESGGGWMQRLASTVVLPSPMCTCAVTHTQSLGASARPQSLDAATTGCRWCCPWASSLRKPSTSAPSTSTPGAGESASPSQVPCSACHSLQQLCSPASQPVSGLP